MTLTEFLEARFAEDEAVARAAMVRPIKVAAYDWRPREVTPDHIDVVWYTDAGMSSPSDSGSFVEGRAHFEYFSPARVLAECAAKRAVIEYLAPDLGRGYSSSDTAEEVLRILALPYADHPDYDEAWRP